jgi:hypothetical protein
MEVKQQLYKDIDKTKITRIWNVCFPNENFIFNSEDDNVYYIENPNSNNIIAFAMLTKSSPKLHIKEEAVDRVVYLYNLMVHPLHQHKHIGTQIINFICDDIQKNPLYNDFRHLLHADYIIPTDLKQKSLLTNFYKSLNFKDRGFVINKNNLDIQCLVKRFGNCIWKSPYELWLESQTK